ncbi:unnamed protein product, partial [Caretta caretta]
MINSTSSEKDEHSEEMAAAAFIPEHLATGVQGPTGRPRKSLEQIFCSNSNILRGDP